MTRHLLEWPNRRISTSGWNIAALVIEERLGWSLERSPPTENGGEARSEVAECRGRQARLCDGFLHLANTAALALDDAGAIGGAEAPADIIEVGVDRALTVGLAELMLRDALQTARTRDDEFILDDADLDALGVRSRVEVSVDERVGYEFADGAQGRTGASWPLPASS